MGINPLTKHENSQHKRELGVFGVVTGLVSLHYGMGFILGTGEAVYEFGPSGTIYAISAGLGLICFAVLAGFYWREHEPIWELLGNKYGEKVRHLTNVLSWTWMLGTMAAQILSASFALSVLGVNSWLSMVIIAIVIAILGPISLDSLKWLFVTLLVISTSALVFGVNRLGGMDVLGSEVSRFFPAIVVGPIQNTLGVSIATILLTMIGMDFQQVVVGSRSKRVALVGSIIAGICLLPLAFLPTGVVRGAINLGMVAPGLNGKQVIPFVLSELGNQVIQNGGAFLVVGLILVAINSGTGLNRALIMSFTHATFLPRFLTEERHSAFINSLAALGIALTGYTIVGLIVSFYAIYVAGVFVPFLAYLLERKGLVHMTSRTVLLSLAGGGGLAAAMLVISIFTRWFGISAWVWFATEPELWMLTFGMLAAAIIIVIGVLVARGRQIQPNDSPPNK